MTVKYIDYNFVINVFRLIKKSVIQFHRCYILRYLLRSINPFRGYFCDSLINRDVGRTKIKPKPFGSLRINLALRIIPEKLRCVILSNCLKFIA